MSGIAVDVTWFSRQPARSGVQRVLGQLAQAWPESDDETLFVARGEKGVFGVRPAQFACLVDDLFALSGVAGVASADVLETFHEGRQLRTHELDRMAWLLPEPSYDPGTLADLEARSGRGARVAALAHDCFPMTHPQFLPLNGQAGTSPYFRFLARLPLVMATSQSVAEVLVHRLRRDARRTPVTWLGTDHIRAARSSAERARADLLVAGVVEPRKRVALAIDAVEHLRQTVPDARLVVVGRPGSAEPSDLRRLRRLSDESDLVIWRDDADDEELLLWMAKATALLALGDEGYGMPVVEAAKRGCPVVYGGSQPAATLLDGHGAWRVESSSAGALAQDLVAWCDSDYAAAKRAQIDTSDLPTWQDFAGDIRRHLLS